MARQYAPQITFNADDLRFRKKLGTLSKRIKDLSPALSTVGNMFRASRKTIFSQRGKGKYPDFKRGGPNSVYAQRKQKEVGFKYPLLFKYGTLRSSVVNKGDRDNVTKIWKRRARFGTSVPYAGYHDSPEPRKKIPYRPFLFWGNEVPGRFKNLTSSTATFERRALSVLKKYIITGSRRAKMR